MVLLDVLRGFRVVGGVRSGKGREENCTPTRTIASFSPPSESRTISKPREAVYKPMVGERDSRTPHSGYHFDGTSRLFFEGWYFKVSIPDAKQSFAWMYTSENPGASTTEGGKVVEGPSVPSGAAQIMGADEEYLFQQAPTIKNFWGNRHELALGNTFISKAGATPPNSELDPKDYLESVEEGYQVTPTWHQGSLRDNGSTDFATTVKTARWEYSTRPVYGWGSVGAVQKATAGWLAALPVFEPHWQICMAGGLSTEFEQDGLSGAIGRFEFEDAPSYCEKNWGGSFPQKWFWVQCNVFDGFSGEVALTAGGGRRGLPLLKDTYEDVAMVGLHYEGKFYEFVPWEGKVEWEIAPWGSWKISAQTKQHEVKLEATADVPGCILRAPTLEGFVPLCKDTFAGKLRLQLWERNSDGSVGKTLLDTTSDMCALETGGGPWDNTWEGKALMRQPLKTLLQLPINPDRFFNWIPSFRPPGL